MGGNQYCSLIKLSSTLWTNLGANLQICVTSWHVLCCMQSLVMHHCKAAIAGHLLASMVLQVLLGSSQG